jgi:hypothetical protein
MCENSARSRRFRRADAPLHVRRAATTPIDLKFGAKVHNYFFFRTNALILRLIAHQRVDAKEKKEG